MYTHKHTHTPVDNDMSLIQVVVLKPNGELTVYNTPPDFQSLQELIDGQLELLPLPDSTFKGMHAYVDEEGLLRKRCLNCTFNTFGDIVNSNIVGDVLFSRCDDEGYEIGITPLDVDLLHHRFGSKNISSFV